ncbi:carbohydrate kinase family protein [Arenicella xantha]|uniref:Adenosine kinase n=1 Tax=Arenicella xantha TaxID=644221 RepID=A0A395JHM6_9GAMM|nr:carbohydrate kinase family protein [Arenicella xantha]RBP49640.1 adenosine kinase [Arenicella xantha]
MKTLVTGSLAFDTIMVFEDQFKNHILPDQTHILNVSFLVPEMTRHYGGCAGNIAYTLAMLGGDPLIMATVGEDFGAYSQYLEQKGLNQEYVTQVAGTFTGQCFITTDVDNNQINAFHPGAMNHAHVNKVGDASGIELGIVGPDGRDAMIQHSEQFAELNIPFVFDPGQGLPMFDGADCLKFLSEATYTIVNDYESQMLLGKTGLTLEQLAEKVDALIVTRGGSGSEIYANGEKIVIPSAPISSVVDPTGCGDAYRAGVLFGLAKGYSWQVCGQIGALCGAIKIEHSGTQNHAFTMSEFAERYRSAFGQDL